MYRYKSHLLGQAREQIPAPQKVEDKVELPLRLEGVVQGDDEGVRDEGEDVALLLGPLSVPHCRGVQHLLTHFYPPLRFRN